MSQQVDKRIINKIDQLVGEGVRQVREMQRHIRIFVKTELFRNAKLPASTSRRYHPKRKDIRNHMYKATMKLKFSKLDQENLEEKVKQWQQQAPQDKFFFRGYGTIIDGVDTETTESDNIDDDVEVSMSITHSKILNSYFKKKKA